MEAFKELLTCGRRNELNVRPERTELIFGAIGVRRDCLAYDSSTHKKGTNDKAMRVSQLHPKLSNNPSNRARPSVPPKSGSTTRSGCGISPSTLRFSLRMPAILRALPLGFSPSA